MIIKGFWHIYMINHWYDIVMDQLRIMINSGLYDAAQCITIGCLGTPEQLKWLQSRVIDQYPKLRLGFYDGDHTLFEFKTLELITIDNGDYAGFYIHTKGVTRPGDVVAAHWRGWMNECILNRWRDHYHIINNGLADVSSMNHCTPPKHPEHFSGNFWWFDREYIDRCPKLTSLRRNNRWQAEQWICMGHGRFHAPEFVEPGRDNFVMKHDHSGIS
jgi:hypothetical protein